jgi:hypothetical protein
MKTFTLLYFKAPTKQGLGLGLGLGCDAITKYGTYSATFQAYLEIPMEWSQLDQI